MTGAIGSQRRDPALPQTPASVRWFSLVLDRRLFVFVRRSHTVDRRTNGLSTVEAWKSRGRCAVTPTGAPHRDRGGPADPSRGPRLRALSRPAIHPGRHRGGGVRRGALGGSGGGSRGLLGR